MRTTKNIIIMSELNDVESIMQHNALSCVYDEILTIKKDLGSIRFSVIYFVSDSEVNCWIFDVTSSRDEKTHAILLSVLGASQTKWIKDYRNFKRIRLLPEKSLPVKRTADIAAILEIKQENKILQCKSVTEKQAIKRIILNHKGWRKRFFGAEFGSEE